MHPHPRRADAQPAQRRSRHPPRPAGRRHRPSGSGKSSLAFDTLYAEGQRQYIESLSIYARQFLHQLERPDVDLIEGLQPTISVDQRAGGHNPRSTVATVTEIYDYLRLLLCPAGRAALPPLRRGRSASSRPNRSWPILVGTDGRTRVMVLAPLVRGRKGEHKDVFDTCARRGFRPRAGRRRGGRRQRAAAAGAAESTTHRGGRRSRDDPRRHPRPRLAESINLAIATATGWC